MANTKFFIPIFLSLNLMLTSCNEIDPNISAGRYDEIIVKKTSALEVKELLGMPDHIGQNTDFGYLFLHYYKQSLNIVVQNGTVVSIHIFANPHSERAKSSEYSKFVYNGQPKIIKKYNFETLANSSENNKNISIVDNHLACNVRIVDPDNNVSSLFNYDQDKNLYEITIK